MSKCYELCLWKLRKWRKNFLHQFKPLIGNVNRCKKIDFKASLHSSNFAAMEASSQIKQVFKLIDTDGDGKLSSFELSGLLISLGHKKCAAKKEAEKMIRELDSNGDGCIDLNAIIECGSEEDELMDAFLLFDIDKNGFISAKVLHQVLTGLGYKECDFEERFLMIKGVDKDGNGLVDFQEFKSMMATV